MFDRISLAGRISGDPDLANHDRNGEAEGSQSHNATRRSLLSGCLMRRLYGGFRCGIQKLEAHKLHV